MEQPASSDSTRSGKQMRSGRRCCGGGAAEFGRPASGAAGCLPPDAAGPPPPAVLGAGRCAGAAAGCATGVAGGSAAARAGGRCSCMWRPCTIRPPSEVKALLLLPLLPPLPESLPLRPLAWLPLPPSLAQACCEVLPPGASADRCACGAASARGLCDGAAAAGGRAAQAGVGTAPPPLPGASGGLGAAARLASSPDFRACKIDVRRQHDITNHRRAGCCAMPFGP